MSKDANEEYTRRTEVLSRMYHIRDTGSNTRGEHVELKHGQRREIEIGNREKEKKRKEKRDEST